jgi:hypothetical protein
MMHGDPTTRRQTSVRHDNDDVKDSTKPSLLDNTRARRDAAK